MYPLCDYLGGLDIFHCSESRKLLIPQKNSIGRTEMANLDYPSPFPITLSSPFLSLPLPSSLVHLILPTRFPPFQVSQN